MNSPFSIFESFTQKRIGDTSFLKPFCSSLIKYAKKSKADGKIYRLAVYMKGEREDLQFGDVYTVPAAVCNSQDRFPRTLLKRFVAKGLTVEQNIELNFPETGFEISKDVLKAAKDKIFTDEKGDQRTLIVFVPAWHNSSEFSGFFFDEDPEVFEGQVVNNVFTVYQPSFASSVEHVVNQSSSVFLKLIGDDFSRGMETIKNVWPDLANACYPQFNEVEAITPEMKIKASANRPTIRMTSSYLGLVAASMPEIEEAILDDKELEVLTQVENHFEEVVDTDLDSHLEPDAGTSHVVRRELPPMDTDVPGPVDEFPEGVIAALKSQLPLMKAMFPRMAAEVESGLRDRPDYGSPESKEGVSMTAGGYPGGGTDPDDPYGDNPYNVPGTEHTAGINPHTYMIEPNSGEIRVRMMNAASKFNGVVDAENPLTITFESGFAAADFMRKFDKYIVDKAKVASIHETVANFLGNKQAISWLKNDGAVEEFYPQAIGENVNYLSPESGKKISPYLDLRNQKDQGSLPVGPGGNAVTPEQQGIPLRREMQRKGLDYYFSFYAPQDVLDAQYISVAASGKMAMRKIADITTTPAELAKALLTKVLSDFVCVFTGNIKFFDRVLLDTPIDTRISLHDYLVAKIPTSDGSVQGRMDTAGLLSRGFDNINDSDLADLLTNSWAKSSVIIPDPIAPEGKRESVQVYARAETINMETKELTIRYIVTML